MIHLFSLLLQASQASEGGVDPFAALFGGIMGLFAAMYAAFFLVFLLFVLLVFASIVGGLWALYEIITAENQSDWKVLWVLAVLLIGIFGVVLYYFVGRKERKAPKK